MTIPREPDLETIFRAYDIRGIFGKQLTGRVATKLGIAIGNFLGRDREVVVGRDVRLSGESLRNALVSGLLQECCVTDIGVVPTPLLFFTMNQLKMDAGIMITASHNPPEWNGFKLFTQRGCIYGDDMNRLKQMTREISYGAVREACGQVLKHKKVLQEYMSFVCDMIGMEKELTIVADTANGTCGLLVPSLFKQLDCNILTLNERPNGKFPAHLPEPRTETLGELTQRTKKSGADFGVGYDGDGDRAVFVDDKGKIVPGNITLLILARDVLQRKNGGKVVFELGCSMAVEECIMEYGGIPIVDRVGHAFIMDRMIAENAVFGGETSGHFYFPELYGMDDAIFASLRMAEILSRSERKLSEVVDSLPKYPSISETSIDCPDDVKFDVVHRLKAKFRNSGLEILDIDGVKLLDEEGWVLLRPSNTEPVIRISAEAKTEAKLKELYDFTVKELKRVMEGG
ncbi:MAG: phosphomannomutase/phosphoglucomutase [Candidatus Bathyarchaeota archaeon]|nr:MAG: phosphomannomutase/phosphoglucomutase [Candidatus Bathyarchaeota archaeon]